MATEVLATTRDPRTFVDPDVWDREIALLVRDNPFDRVMAERIFGQGIAYLITAMEKWDDKAVRAVEWRSLAGAERFA
ncbi:hypothetical protein [Actinomadura harenae]|uniref:Uncharacterized protein n=1 Tax=Actinomadura harenae TaxID=2483351 RepID=A0A3M2M7A8_9ACTN|nr:hypothetical protein [Actinomadura harenae]RMI45476.1 hypothetical protein EBO15_09700 [Actinomadura harenae]